MTDFTLSFATETGQVVVQGTPAGAAGAVALIPVPGLELSFDRVDGRLTEAVIDVTGAGEIAKADEITLDERVAAMLTRLFGRPGPDLMLRIAAAPPQANGPARIQSPEPDLTATLSRLARLEYVRYTSPLPPGSPWWATEMAELAQRACLPERAQVEARLALVPLLEWLRRAARRQLPEQAIIATRTVAALRQAAEPESASRLLASLKSRSGAPPGSPSTLTWDVAAEKRAIVAEPSPHAGLQWMIDPQLLGLWGPFRPGLSPYSDLVVQAGDEAEGRRLTVAAQLARPADAGSLDRCRVRVVDPDPRRVLAQARFGDAVDPSTGRSRTEFSVHYPIGELREIWIEVVADKRQPVRSVRGYRSERALRWADAALRAERAPQGLAPRATAADWAALAAVAWDRSRRDWAAAGDGKRAQLARAAGRSLADGPACLAELLGG